jgi:ribulose-5-phosphate 4-epimerase/fuculose-1-phosphate aldolase
VEKEPLLAARVRDQVTPEEWETRVRLAAAYRLFARLGLTDGISNHITARAPDEGLFLINPWGLLFEEVTASNLHTIDHDGNVVRQGETDFGVNKAGYVIHSAIHAARADVFCVAHTHTRAGVAVSAMECGLMPVSQTALRFLNRVGYHDYEGPAVDEGERERLVQHLGRNDALILRNHGLLTCGRSIAEACHLMTRLEAACQIQVDLMATNTPMVIPSQEAQERTAALFAPTSNSKEVVTTGGREWDALVRQLDRDDDSYKS